MPRKSRKRKQSGSVGKKRVQTKKKRKARVSARDQKIAKIVVDSLWRVKTADKETTSTGKEVLSGWQRCRIVERLDANESVRVCQLSTQLTTSYIQRTRHQFTLRQLRMCHHLLHANNLTLKCQIGASLCHYNASVSETQKVGPTTDVNSTQPGETHSIWRDKDGILFRSALSRIAI